MATNKVEGIHSKNTYMAEFLNENLFIAHNLINVSYLTKDSRVIFLGSSCDLSIIHCATVKHLNCIKGREDQLRKGLS